MRIRLLVAVMVCVTSMSCDSLVLPTSLGGQCELTSECDAPLVCRQRYCRKECQTSRDCAAGLHCWLDNAGLGSCELPLEAGCTLDSDCPEILVCNAETNRCSNECNCTGDGPCRDCPPGADCVADVGTGIGSCVDNDICAYATDCESGEVCLDGFCRPFCNSARDCQLDEMCVTLEYADETGRGITMACRCELTIEIMRHDAENPGSAYMVCEAE